MTLTSLLRSALPAAAFSLAIGIAPSFAGDPPEYVYLQLGTLGGPDSVGYGLNASGQVVGWSSIPDCITEASETPCRRAYVWQDGVMTELGVLPGDDESFARAINDAGLVVGTSEVGILFGSGTFHAVAWSGGAISALADLGESSVAHDVNASGVVAGWARDTSLNQDRAVTWSGGAINNPGATEPHQSNRFVGLNDFGILVGLAWNLFQPNDAVLFDGVKWEDIGGLDGPFQNAEANDVNNTGTAVGLQAFPSGAWHAALWVLGVGAIDAGTLPGKDYGELYSVNDAGYAVGGSYTDPLDSVAVLWDGDTLHDLNDLLPAGVDAHLFEAREINANGDIVGSALVDGHFRAFLMLADPEVGTWEDLGSALGGSAGEPALDGSGALIAGTQSTIELSNALPGATARLVAGFGELNAPFRGGVMVPTPDLMFPAQIVNGAGELTLRTTWPGEVPSDFAFTMQYWIQDAGGALGWAASNGLRATTP
ncbi:MAG: hypothetical protein DHS20C15_30100 [Planctomycetota bacterium]|nr:MAG: hypothetical protein DHS20C15_30100 [Planctomycetota bacterium]